jgi:hypothetical protein
LAEMFTIKGCRRRDTLSDTAAPPASLGKTQSWYSIAPDQGACGSRDHLSANLSLELTEEQIEFVVRCVEEAVKVEARRRRSLTAGSITNGS